MPPRLQSVELQRVANQLALAQDAAEAAQRQRDVKKGSGHGRGARKSRRPDGAIEAQARQRAGELAARTRKLQAAGRSQTAWGVDRAQDLARYAAIHEELGRRRGHWARAAIIEQPAYLVTELGPYPERRSQRGTWDRAATRIQMYRQDFGVDDPRIALGPEPSEYLQRSAWRDTRRDLERARRELDRPGERMRERGR